MSLWSNLKKHQDNQLKKSPSQIIKVWNFHGGIHPPEMKSPANLKPLSSLPLVDHYLIPLQQHMGQEAELCVKIGDRVLKGQPLTFGFGRSLPVHAPTSGAIEALVQQPSATYWGEKQLSILLKTDFKDESFEFKPLDYLNTKPAEILEYLQQAGIAGLGGAGFPTAVKLDHQNDQTVIDALIINAAECEPYISADDRLMREKAEELITGLDVLRKLLRAREVLIGIEDNKPEAYSALRSALDKTELVVIKRSTKIIKVPTKYPSGGAKQLIKLLTGKEISSGKHASDIGICMLNVGTLYAIKRAVLDGEPLIERVVTLTGTAFSEPANYWIRIGTPIELLLKQVRFDQDKLNGRNLVMGGPLMGFEVSHHASVIKTTNCLLARSDEEIAIIKPQISEQSCIRCGECVAVCPANLLPQQLFWFSQSEEHEKAQHYHLFDCIECGACEYVCPSHIPLVHYYKVQKKAIRELEADQKLAALAKARYTAKLERMEAEKQAREARHKALTTNINDNDKSAVAAAIARVKAKKSVEPAANKSVSNGSVVNESVTDRIELQTVQQSGSSDSLESSATKITLSTTSAMGSLVDSQVKSQQSEQTEFPAAPRKAAIAAALARAKAKKVSTQVEEAKTTIEEQTTDQAQSQTVRAENDPRKATVAAALARAKAKREAQKSTAEKISPEKSADKVTATPEIVDVTELTAVPELTEAKTSAQAPLDPRKAAVAAALARAKAKREQHKQT